LRKELALQKTQVLALHMGCVDVDFTLQWRRAASPSASFSGRS
jgi:hypothetical protein